ncbi:ATP synthase F0 subunit B [Clostridiales bacterium COT073_COT-073]|nr:ATP synthase F0 subunit B [Clostridiales bacterium COT073_COT-073]
MHTVYLAAEPISRLFGLDAETVSSALIVMLSMFLLFVLLGYLLFDPVKQFLAQRQEKIANKLHEADQAEIAAHNMKEEYEAKLKEIQKEYDNILEESRKKALDKERKILADAQQEAEKIIARGRLEIEREKAQVQDDIRNQIVEVATLLAGKFIEANMTEDKQRQLIRETMDGMGDDAWMN